MKNLIDAPPSRTRPAPDGRQLNEAWQSDPDDVWDAEEIPEEESQETTFSSSPTDEA